MSNQQLATLDKSTEIQETEIQETEIQETEIQEIVSLILANVREIAEEQDIKTSASLDEHTPLFGKQGLFDSLGLVSLVVAVEEAIADKFGVNVSLADEKAMSQRNSPYRSIGSLAEYANSLIQAEA